MSKETRQGVLFTLLGLFYSTYLFISTTISNASLFNLILAIILGLIGLVFSASILEKKIRTLCYGVNIFNILVMVVFLVLHFMN